MSWNLVIKARDAEGSPIRLRLLRASRGITATATVSIGDLISFPNGIAVEITKVRHEWTPQNHPAAPNSVAYGTCDQNLSPRQLNEWVDEYGMEFIEP